MAKHRRRIRRVLKWGGLGLSLLIAVAWSLSLLWRFSYCYADRFRSDGVWYCSFDLDVSEGVLATQHGSWGQREVGLVVEWSPAWPRWVASHKTSTSPRKLVHFAYIWGDANSGLLPYWWLILPLWMPFLLIALPTAFLWWRDRRVPPVRCQRCGYDLTGDASGVCSECGERI